MNDLVNYIWGKVQRKKTESLNHEKTLRIHPLQIKIDSVTSEPFVCVTPIAKFVSHKYWVEELIEKREILDKLDFDSIKYLFYAYGMIKASEKNNIYALQECLFLNKQITVTRLKDMAIEVWDKARFDKDFILLDKKSVRLATEFFCSLVERELNKTYEDEHSTDLRLVK